MKRILFVCLGNICRSPMAEGVFAKVAEERGLIPPLEFASAGTGSWHVGDPPDARAVAAARSRGVDISRQRARQVHVDDFDTYDLLIAMDEANVETLRAAAPEHHHAKIKLFLAFADGVSATEVPDPYYGGADGFSHALDLIEAASRGLADYVAGMSG